MKNPPRKGNNARGFALIVALSLMVLLLTLALGLLSLSSVELRKTASSRHDAIARQNALLAIQLAIGELQEHLGPDKRTSANAELLADDFPNPHWVGAWNTEGGFRNWLVSGNEHTGVSPTPETDPDPPTNLPSIALQTDQPTQPNYGKLLVGGNSAGPIDTDFVIAPLVPLKSTVSGKIEGRYAWWVGDEGAKANLAATVGKLPAASADAAEHMKFFASSPNRGFPVLGGEWKTWLPDGPDPVLEHTAGKLITSNQVSLANPNLTDEVKSGFHDFTVSSAGVLSDSLRGGLRKDFSIAFEIPERSFENSEFTRVLTAGEPDEDLAYATTQQGRSLKLANGPLANRATKTAINFQDPEWRGFPGFDEDFPLVYRGPTFDQLRDHYQLYRRVQSPFTANASVAAQPFRPNVRDMIGDRRLKGPWANYFGQERALVYILSDDAADGNNFMVQDSYNDNYAIRRRPMTTELLPEIIRFTYTLSFQAFQDPTDPEKGGLNLIYNPFFVIHNPYSVKLVSQPLWVRAQRAEMFFSIKSDATTRADTSEDYGSANMNTAPLFLELNRKYGDDGSSSGGNAGGEGDATSNSLDYVLSDNGKISGNISLAPGESRMYFIGGNSLTDFATLFEFGKVHNRTVYLKAYDDVTDDFTATGLYTSLTKGGSPYSFKKTSRLSVQCYIKIPGQRTAPNFPGIAWVKNEWLRMYLKLVPPGLTNEKLPLKTHEGFEEIRLYQFAPNDYWAGSIRNAGALARFQYNDVAPPLLRKFAGKADVYVKPTNDGTTGRDNYFSLSTHNPRAMVQNPAAAGRQGPASTRGPTTWSGSATQINDNTPGFDDRFWGSGTRASEGGQKKLVLWDIPRSPLKSLAAFQSANLSRLSTVSAYAVGNSYASPYVPADKVWRRERAATTEDAHPHKGYYWNLDDSYIFNQELYDTYYFSGINPGRSGSGWNNTLGDSSILLGAGDPTDEAPLQAQIDAWINGESDALPNPHFQFVLPTGRSKDDAMADLKLATAYSDPQTTLASVEGVRPHNAIASYMLNQGAFNVNSVSVDAWQTLLAGLRGAAVMHLNGSSLGSDQEKDQSPFPRTSLPGADSTTGDDSQLWNGFRSLTDSQIETLATELVAEIKSRARSPQAGQARPFTTLGEFVNRRLTAFDATKPFSQSGALQAAIDRAVNTNPSSLSSSGRVIPADTNFTTEKYTDNGVETTSREYANPKALAGVTIAGAPQWLMQADVLEHIGPQLSARSDTFTIRAYGESLAETGEVRGRAWVEAVVQRETAYVDPTLHPALTVPDEPAADINRAYGRRFKIVSLRWLSPNEI